jgi:hypothetical protein
MDEMHTYGKQGGKNTTLLIYHLTRTFIRTTAGIATYFGESISLFTPERGGIQLAFYFVGVDHVGIGFIACARIHEVQSPMTHHHDDRNSSRLLSFSLCFFLPLPLFSFAFYSKRHYTHAPGEYLPSQ